MSLLASIYATIGADLSQLDRQFAVAVQKGSRAGRDTGREFLASIKSSLSSGSAFGGGGMTAALGIEGAGTLLDQLKGKLEGIGRVGGIDYAAQVQRQAAAYTRLFGSAKLARDVIKEVQKNSAEAGVDSLDQLAALRKFNALPVAKQALPGILRTTTDTAAAYGLNGGEKRRLVDNIGDIFGNGFDKAQSNQFQMLGINVEKTLGLGLGKTLKNEAAAIAEARKLTPTEQGNAFIRGLEKQFGGMGKETAQSTYLGQLDRAREIAVQAGEASGALAIKLLGPLTSGLVMAATAAGWLNNATGGGAGLAFMAIAAGVALYSTVKTGMVAVQTLYLLNQQLKTLAATSTTAAATTAAQGALGVVAGGAAGGGLLAKLAGRFPALAGIGGKLGGIGGKLAGLGGKANIAGLVMLGAQLGLGAITGNMAETDPRKKRLSAINDEASTWGGYGALAGGLAGLVLGGPAGALAGAGIGGLVGGIGGGIYGGFKSLDTPTANGPGSELSQAAKDLTQAAAKVGNISSIGGGARVSGALKTVESMYALQGAF